MMKRIIEKRKEIAGWILVVFLLVSMPLLIYYLQGEYWIDKFLRTEFMQEKIYSKVSKLVDNYSFHDLHIDTYERYETEHFSIYYKTKDKDLLQNVARSAEEIYQPVCEIMRYTRNEKTTIILIPDSENPEYTQFANLIRITEKVVNDEFYTPKEIISHEFTHILLRDLTRDNMLSWFNEGIAVYVESSISKRAPYDLAEKDFEYTYKVKELQKNFRKIPSREAYCQGYLSVKYIVSNYGEDTLFKIINELKDDRVNEEILLQKYLGMDYKTFYEKIVEYKKELKTQS